MKTILVATDFSQAANNAVNYAAHLAESMQAKLLLFHAYNVPVIISEVPVMMPNLEEVEKDSLKRLKHLQSKLMASFNKAIEIDFYCTCGFAIDEIKNYTEKNGVDFIVLGMQGAGALSEKLIGSVTSTLINETKIPVICMNHKDHFKSYKKIVFACDLGEFKNTQIFEPIKKFIQLFNAKLFILNVFNKNHSEPTITEAVAGFRLDQILADVNHQLCYVENNDVVEGINEFVKEHDIDLLIMMPRHHSFLNKLFNEPHTKKMAFHSLVPLMTIHE
jgi:nucleotide-binding universal stress UspA family protein